MLSWSHATGISITVAYWGGARVQDGTGCRRAILGPAVHQHSTDLSDLTALPRAPGDSGITVRRVASWHYTIVSCHDGYHKKMDIFKKD